jgi:poly-gamma-glutamate biosynthesis protein PgsC/CapC
MEAMDFLLGTEYNYTYIAIGLGMVISLFLTETLGIMAGGIIVPGYFALYLHNPAKIIFTFLISMLAYSIVYLLSKFILIYGRRRLILSLLTGFFLGYILRIVLDNSGFQIMVNDDWIELEYIGYIIPGLIASWMDRQGILRTVSVVLIVASIVNLIMMYIYYLDQFRILYV